MLNFLKRLFGLGAQPQTKQPPQTAKAPSRPATPAADSTPPSAVPAQRKPPVIESWAYQLQDIKPGQVAAVDVDLVVVDYASDGSDDTAFKPADVRRMQQRPGGGRKLVAAYMSIGEAESYRYYWNKSWKKKETRPEWLGKENPDWDENFLVRYWNPDWQKIILGSPNAYLDRIVAAGFDGVYLDIVDAFESWERTRKSAPEEMIEFVCSIAAHARAKNPDFLVIPQNGERLLDAPRYRSAISAVAKEDLYFGIEDDEVPNDPEEIEEALAHLARAKKAGLPVLAIEYLNNRAKIREALLKLNDQGFVPYFGPRDLDKIRPTTIVS